MPRMTFDELNQALDQALEAGVIYNTDFNMLKTRASRLFEDDTDKMVRDPFTHAGRFEDRTEEELEAIDALPLSNLSQFPSKKFIAALNNLDQNTPVARALNDLLNKWKPINDKLKALKSLVQKGRKPSTDPRKTPERTLDNTGTCPVCGQNVKLKGETLVQHGYKVRWNQFIGNCFGVGYKPVEISPEGIREYLVYLQKIRQDTVDIIKRHQAENLPVPSFMRRETKPIDPSDDRYPMAMRNFIANLENDIRFINKDIETFREALDNWGPRPLPGTK